MKVRVGNEIYDSEYTYIAILLSDKDKDNISRMPEENNVYSSFPEDMDLDEVRKRNKELKNE